MKNIFALTLTTWSRFKQIKSESNRYPDHVLFYRLWFYRQIFPDFWLTSLKSCIRRCICFSRILRFFFFIAVFLLDLLVILSIIHIYIKNLPSKKQMRESYLGFIEKPIRWLLIGWLLIGWLLLRRMVIGWLLLYLMFNSSPQVLYQHILTCLNRACSIKSVYGLLFDLNKQLGKDWLKQKHEIL